MVSVNTASSAEEKDLLKNGKFLFVLCWIAYAFNYIGRYNYSACMSSMIADGVIPNAGSGVISALFLVSYGGGQFVNGIFGDKISPKYMIGTGLALSAIANFLMGFSHSFVFSCVIWCFNGYACSMLWSPIIRLFAEFMIAKQSMRAVLDISTAIPAGSLMAFGVSALLLKLFTWRRVFVGCAFIVAFAALLWFVGCSTPKMREYLSKIVDVKTKIGEGNCRAQESGGKSKNGANGVAILLATGVVFTIAAVFCNGLIKESVTQFVPKYLSDVFSVTGSAAAAVTMILPIVNIAGAYAARAVMIKAKNNEFAAAGILFAVSTVSSVLLNYTEKSGIVLAVLLIAVTTSTMLGVNTLLLSYIPLSYSRVGLSSSLTGVLDALAYIASALAAFVFGEISNMSGWGTVTILWGIIGTVGILICIAEVPIWAKSKDRLENHAESFAENDADNVDAEESET